MCDAVHSMRRTSVRLRGKDGVLPRALTASPTSHRRRSSHCYRLSRRRKRGQGAGDSDVDRRQWAAPNSRGQCRRFPGLPRFLPVPSPVPVFSPLPLSPAESWCSLPSRNPPPWRALPADVPCGSFVRALGTPAVQYSDRGVPSVSSRCGASLSTHLSEYAASPDSV